MKKRIAMILTAAAVACMMFVQSLRPAGAIEFRNYPAYVLTLENVSDVNLTGKDERGNEQNLKLVTPRLPVMRENGTWGTLKDATAAAAAGKKALVVTDVADPRTTAYAILLEPSVVEMNDWSQEIREATQCFIDSYNPYHDTMTAHSFVLRNAGSFQAGQGIYIRKDGSIIPLERITPGSKGILVWLDFKGKHHVLLVRETD
jgi:hypothetical protein